MRIKSGILFFALIQIILVGCEPDCWTEIKYADYTIKYEVTGSASSVSLTFENSDGGTSQLSNISIPWSYSYTASYDTWAYCSAQNQSDNGSVTVKIYIDDVKNKESTSSGANVISTASMSINGEFHKEYIEHCD